MAIPTKNLLSPFNIICKNNAQKKRNTTKHIAHCIPFVLGYPDSNLEKQDQNLQCYHYTILQCLKLTGVFCCFLNTAAKLRLSIEPSKFSVHFFSKNQLFLVHRVVSFALSGYLPVTKPLLEGKPLDIGFLKLILRYQLNLPLQSA